MTDGVLFQSMTAAHKSAFSTQFSLAERAAQVPHLHQRLHQHCEVLCKKRQRSIHIHSITHTSNTNKEHQIKAQGLRWFDA